MKDIVKTNEKDWLEKAIKFYTAKKLFTFVDDAGLKITEADLKSAVTLIRAAKARGAASWQQIASVLAGVGITGIGVWMIAAAIVDPEPTSKLGLLIAGGIVLALTGALGTLAGLGVRFVVSAKSPQGHTFEIKPE
jgi:flagellar motor component MotA